MIEVIPHSTGYRWRWISALGRTLVDCFTVHPCDMAAWNAAKHYRITFWAEANAVDHRQGRCV